MAGSVRSGHLELPDVNRSERGRDVRPPATSLLTPTIAASEVRTPIPFMRPVELCAFDHPIFHTIHFRTIPLNSWNGPLEGGKRI